MPEIRVGAFARPATKRATVKANRPDPPTTVSLTPPHPAADPRAAVIEAYARMEHVLAKRELGRQTAEAPREYLRRVMRDQGMPEESLTALTALFEEARFSRHPIPESARRRAATELKTARAALAAASILGAETV